MFETKKVPQAEAERQERFAAAVRQELINRPRSCYIETYGCQMNVRDSEIAAGQLLSMGFTAAPSLEEADLVLFNPDTVLDGATFENPFGEPTGISHVFVGGRLAVKDGVSTGAAAGKVLRKG